MADQLPVFVYGTLRDGMANHGVIQPFAETIRPATLPGHRLYSAGLPYIAEDGTPHDTVTGDLVVLRPDSYDEALADLDCLEGYAPPAYLLYVRSACTALAEPAPGEATQPIRAWVYHGGRSFDYSPGLLVGGGDWLTARDARWARRRASDPAA